MDSPATPFTKTKPSECMDSTGKVIPVSTLKERKTEASSALKLAEMERKHNEELRWLKKQAEHFQSEYEAGRLKRKELEAELEAATVELKTLREQQAETEEARGRGNERVVRLELEAVRRELQVLTEERDTLESQHADTLRDNTRQLSELQDKLTSLSHQHLNIVTQLEALMQTHASLQTQHASATAALRDAQEQASNDAGRADERERALAACTAERDMLQQQVAELQQQLRAAEDLATEQSSAAALAKEEVKSLQLTLCDSEKAVQVAKDETLQLRLKLDALQPESNSLKDEMVRMRHQLEARDQEISDLKASSKQGGAEAQASKAALEKALQECSDLRADYARAVYDMAKAKAEHSEMSGKLAKALQYRDVLHARLNALQMGFTEVEQQARLALDDIRLTDQQAHADDSMPPRSAAACRALLERIRRVAGDALVAAAQDKKTGATVVPPSGVTTSQASVPPPISS